MAAYDFSKAEKKLSKYIDEERLEHTKGVRYTCACMAMAYDFDLEKAQIAGLLHDCAKCIPNKKKLKMCEQYNIEISSFEEKHPFLLHAKLGALIARRKYDIQDEDILNSIKYHTTGRPEMSTLEKIVYIADYIEPMRYKAENLPIIRKIAFEDLDECMYVILKSTLDYLDESSSEIDYATVEAFHYYERLHNEREENLNE